MDFAGKSPAQAAEMITQDTYAETFVKERIIDAIMQFSNRELERRRELQEEVKALRRDVLAVWTPRHRLAVLLGVSDLPADEQMEAAVKRIESLLDDEEHLNLMVNIGTVIETQGRKDGE